MSVLAAGCSIALDIDKDACSKDGDCGAPYVCSAGLCKRKSCEDDTQCRAPGGAYATTFCEQGGCYAAECSASDGQCEDGLVCDTTRNHCIKAGTASCTSHEACARYAGHPVCRDNVCDVAECAKAEDCEGASPTLNCVSGRCEDLVWGCAGEPDERPEPMSATATFKMTVLDLSYRKRIPGLSIKLCTSFDTLCQSPLQEPEIDYDANGLLTITGLQQDSAIHLLLEAADFVPSDIYVQRLARDVSVESQGVQLLPSYLFGSLTESLGIETDLETTAVFSTLFVDCQVPAQPGAGVTLKIDDKPEDVTIYYVRDGNQPTVDLDKTTVIGAAGAVNVPSGRQITLKGYIGDQLISSYAITPYAKHFTYVTMYPRVYTTQ